MCNTIINKVKICWCKTAHLPCFKSISPFLVFLPFQVIFLFCQLLQVSVIQSSSFIKEEGNSHHAWSHQMLNQKMFSAWMLLLLGNSMKKSTWMWKSNFIQSIDNSVSLGSLDTEEFIFVSFNFTKKRLGWFSFNRIWRSSQDEKSCFSWYSFWYSFLSVRLPHMKNKGVRQSRASSRNSEATDVWKVACHPPSRRVLTCSNYFF